jgi:hypothetical protein
MRALKVKVKTLNWQGNGQVWLSQRTRLTILKHDYRYVQICGKVFSLGGKVHPHRMEGYLPIVSLNSIEVTGHLYYVGYYK